MPGFMDNCAKLFSSDRYNIMPKENTSSMHHSEIYRVINAVRVRQMLGKGAYKAKSNMHIDAIGAMIRKIARIDAKTARSD